jgi:hypothetical protein
MHTSELSSFEVEITIGKLKRYKSLCVDHIPAELIQVVCKTLHSENQLKLFIPSRIRKNCHKSGRNLLL